MCVFRACDLNDEIQINEVFFVLVMQGEEGAVELELSKADSYDNVSKALAARLGLDHPLKLRFTGKAACLQCGNDQTALQRGTRACRVAAC